MKIAFPLKRCSKCKETKNISEFSRNKVRKDGYQNQCKQCQWQYYQKNQAQQLRNSKRYNKTINGHLRHVWYAMLQRCNNPKLKPYKDYGGRGIEVKFASFNDFYDYVVKVLKIDPRKLTIDRIDNDGNYEKGNIRFVTMTENCRNRRPQKSCPFRSDCIVYRNYYKNI